MHVELTELLTRLLQADEIAPGDVIELREHVWGDDEMIAQPVAEVLFKLNGRLKGHSRAWTEFFVETITHFMVGQSEPRGFVTEENANWLRGMIDKAGRIGSMPEMEALVGTLEKAENAPEWLKNYALDQIEQAVLTGEGATRTEDTISPNQVNGKEVALLRRLIFAPCSLRGDAVSREEADRLFRIKDATLHSDNSPGWKLLFVQGVGNYLMAHSDYRPMTSDEALRRQQDIGTSSPNVLGFMKRMIPDAMWGTGTLVDAMRAVFPGQADPENHARALSASRAITVEEAAWLKANIAADSETDEYEQALLAFIIDEAGAMPQGFDTSFRMAS